MNWSFKVLNLDWLTLLTLLTILESKSTTVEWDSVIVGSDNNSLTVTNESPARGGSAGLSIEEIRRGAKAFFAGAGIARNPHMSVLYKNPNFH